MYLIQNNDINTKFLKPPFLCFNKRKLFNLFFLCFSANIYIISIYRSLKSEKEPSQFYSTDARRQHWITKKKACFLINCPNPSICN